MIDDFSESFDDICEGYRRIALMDKTHRILFREAPVCDRTFELISMILNVD